MNTARRNTPSASRAPVQRTAAQAVRVRGVRGRQHGDAAVRAQRDRLHVRGRGDLVKCQQRGRHGLEQHERRLLFGAAVEHVRAAADRKLGRAVRERGDLAALVRHRDRIAPIGYEPHPFAQQRGLTQTGRRDQQRGLRARPPRSTARSAPRAPDAAARRVGSATRRRGWRRPVRFRSPPARTHQPVPARKRDKPVSQAVRMAVHRPARRTAERVAQLLRRDRRHGQPLLPPARRTEGGSPAAGAAPRSRPARQAPPAPPRAAGRQRMACCQAPVLFSLHPASPVSLYVRPCPEYAAAFPGRTGVFFALRKS